MYFLCFFFLLLHFSNSGVAAFATVLFHFIYFMQTHTITLSENHLSLTGQIYAEQIPLPKKVTELTVNNLGSRIITLLGNSRKRTAVIVTPGNE